MSDEWGNLYDPGNPVHDSIARFTGFFDNPSRENLAAFMEQLELFNDAKLRLGQAGMEHLGRGHNVTDRRLKWKLMSEHLREGRAWVAIEYQTGISHVEQCYVISNGRDTALVAWDEDLQIECENDIRSGLSAHRIWQLYRDWGLTEHQARSLVRLFRGPD